MKRMFFALNPNAGKGASNNEFFTVIDTFIKNGYDVETYITQKAGELSDILKEKMPYFDTISVWGGDGTLNEAVNGVPASGSGRTVLGYIPRGTVNDFASSLSIPKNAIKAAENICKGKAVNCDLGQFNGRYFTYVAAFGAFTEVSYSTSQAKKKIFSRLAYLIDGATSLSKIKPIHARVTYNGITEQNDYVYGMVSNTKSVGGFKIPEIEVDMNDGMLEVMLVTMPKNIGEWNEIITTLLSNRINSPLIKIVKTNHVEVDFDENTPWTIDGEYGGNEKHNIVDARQSAIKIIIPQ